MLGLCKLVTEAVAFWAVFPLDIVGFVYLLGFGVFLFLCHARAGHYICGLFRDEIFHRSVFKTCTSCPALLGQVDKTSVYSIPGRDYFFKSVKQRSWGITYQRVGSSTVEDVYIIKCLRGRTWVLKSTVMFLFHIIFCVNCLIQTELLMLKPLDLLCSTHEVEVILSGKCAGHEGVRSGTSSEPLLCLSRKRRSHVPLCALVTAVLPREERPHPVSVLCFKPFILSLDYVCLFWVLQSFSVLPVCWSPWSGMRGELFPQRRATIVQKAAKTERWIRFLAKGEQGTCGEK